MAGDSGLARGGASRAAPPDAVLADRLRLALVRLGRQFRRQDPPGLSVTLYSALAAVSDRGEMAIGELAEAEGVPSSAATRIADRLEEAGYVTRRPNPRDRRGVILSITADGGALVENRRARGNAWLTGRLAKLTPAQRETLAQALGVLHEVVLADEGSCAAAAAPAADERGAT